MSDRIINKNRYKKTTRKKADNKKDSSIKKSDRKIKTIKYKKSIKKSSKETNFLTNFLKVSMCIVILIAIVFLSQIIMNFKGDNILNVFSNKDKNQDLKKDISFNIGLPKLDTTDILSTNNVIVNEYIKKLYGSLISIKKDYSINYDIAKKIDKVDNLNYIIYLKEELNINISDIENSIKAINLAGEKNPYYNNIKNISKIVSLNEYSMKVTLKESNPYFIYTLNFPLYNMPNEKNNKEYLITKKEDNNIDFERNKSNSTIKNIGIKSYNDNFLLVNDFKEKKIDMFTASSDNLIQYIGKYDYNIKKYRDGETVILLGNKDSELFSKQEIRKALAYSINRDEIVKKVDSSFSEVIDLPYIYLEPKYKYDIYAAENILLENSWKKESGVYQKKIDGKIVKAELNVLVNEDDKIKLEISELIKQMVERIGIKLNIVKMKENKITEEINNKKYDLVLTTIYINENPNISFIENFLNINEEINIKIEAIKNSDIENLSANVNALQDTLSKEISCIGILAKDTAIIYQKDIVGFENVDYMKVFSNLDKIGKIK